MLPETLLFTCFISLGAHPPRAGRRSLFRSLPARGAKLVIKEGAHLVANKPVTEVINADGFLWPSLGYSMRGPR
jgi:hypothetical protein